MNFMNRSNPVGFLSSGIGGLSVVKEAMSLMPNENVVSFSDTARAPYGPKSNEAIIENTLQGARFLMRKNIKLLVVACNSASSAALDELRKNVEVPVVGVIEPALRLAVETTKNKKIGVIGTAATINNKSFSAQIKSINPKVKVFEKACPLFVPFAQEGLNDHKALKLIAKEYLEELKERDIDTLILGSVAYPLIAETIGKVIGRKVNLISSGVPASFVIKNYLEGRGIRSQSVQIGHPEFYVSDFTERLKKSGELFLGRKIENLYKVDL